MWGDKVIDALLCAHMRRVKISKKGEAATIEDRISEWLREMDLAYSFSLEPIGALKDDNYGVQIQKSAMSPAVTLADMGYGLADVLPMLVLCYYTPESSTLILEQPGIHLHPKAQADLADLLIEVITERKLQILNREPQRTPAKSVATAYRRGKRSLSIKLPFTFAKTMMAFLPLPPLKWINSVTLRIGHRTFLVTR